MDFGHAIANLDVSASVCETNEPINREAGNIAQADLERDTAQQCRAAITLLRAAQACDPAAA